MKSRVLLVDDEETAYDSLREILKREPVEIIWAKDGSEGVKTYNLYRGRFATVIIDYLLPNNQKGSEIALHLHKLDQHLEIIFVTGHKNPDYFADLLATGVAKGFFLKGTNPQEIRQVVISSIHRYMTQHRLIEKRNEDDMDHVEKSLRSIGLVGRSRIMFDVYRQVERYRDSKYRELSILILGESGVGKEKIARALTADQKKFFAVNCARFSNSENFVETELFGYTKGSYTGAEKDSQGIFAQAKGGTVFLDELHKLPVTAQDKLLRVLQERKIRRVGDNGSTEIPVDFKLIAAAKPSIDQMVKDHRFGEDLFHRISQLEIVVPTLSDRIEDLEPLVEEFSDRICAKIGQKKFFRASTIEAMKSYSWPGNVRQLENVVQRLVADSEGDTIEPLDFLDYLKRKKDILNLPESITQVKLESYLKLVESEYIVRVLEDSVTQMEAAKKMGLPPSTLCRKLLTLGIKPEAYLKQF